jgi:hypothetical protein
VSARGGASTEYADSDRARQGKAGGWNLDTRCPDPRGLADRLASGSERLEVEDDRFADQALDFLPRVANDADARQVAT